MNTLKYFMWGYQPHFRISAQNAAERIFKQLDKKFEPNVFLIGILNKAVEGYHPICVEPEDCGYNPEIFSDINQIAENLEKLDEDRNIFHTDSNVHQSYLRLIKLRALKNAVEKILNTEYMLSKKTSFCSMPVEVENYLVFTVLQLSEDVINSHYSLYKTKFENRFSITRSLIDSVISEYLSACSKALNRPSPGANLNIIERDAQEIIRSAGKNFMYTVSSVGKNFDGLHGLYEACVSISALKYEGVEGVGSLIIARKNHPNIKLITFFKKPISITNPRAVRKLLELCDLENSLISDSAFIYGIGRMEGYYNMKEEDVFHVHFTNHYCWRLDYLNNPLMDVNYGQPSLPQIQLDRSKFFNDLKRIFKGIETEKIDDIWRLFCEAISHKQGTIIIITEGAEEESHRLMNQCIRIEPKTITPAEVKTFTKIDGALLINTDCTCYAIGVILDGLATFKCDPSRGSRFNSVIRYIESCAFPSIALIISEDGYVNLIPDLFPQIKKSDITKTINVLHDINKKSVIEVKEFNKTMDWLDNHRFYLLPEMCDEINKLENEITQKIDPTMSRIVWRKFDPNSEMNASYFVAEL